MKTKQFTLFLVLLLLLCGLRAATPAQTPHHASRKTLDHPTTIQGYPCAKGYAWFFDDDRLYRCTVTQEIPFGEVRIPAGTYIALTPQGIPDFVQMSHDALILGLTCQGGSFLGPSEGSVVTFYPNGKLKLCFLARDQIVQGIPCAHGGFFASLNGVDPGVSFDEGGKLISCRLSKDFGAQHRGERYVQAPAERPAAH